VSTAKDRVVFFDSMTNDVGATIRASRCKGLDGTFETIECVAGAIHGYLESFIVVVTAGLAFRHGMPLVKLMSEQTIDSCCGFHFLAVVTQASAYLPDCHAENNSLTAVPCNNCRKIETAHLSRSLSWTQKSSSDLVDDFSAHRIEAFLSFGFRDSHWLRGQLKYRRLLTATQLCQENNAPIRKFERIMVRPLLVLIDLSEDCGRVS
jgi:hypothetical protein